MQLCRKLGLRRKEIFKGKPAVPARGFVRSPPGSFNEGGKAGWQLISQSLGFHRLQRRCLSCVSGISFFWGVFLYYSRVLEKKTCRAPMNGKTGFNRVTHKYSSSGIENSILVFCILGIGQNAQCKYISIQLEMMAMSSLRRKTGDFHVGLESGPWASESRVAVHRLLFTKGQSPQNIHSKFPFTAAWKPILVIIVQVIFYVFWADFLSSHKSGRGIN